MEDGRRLTECIRGIGDAAIVFAQSEAEKEGISPLAHSGGQPLSYVDWLTRGRLTATNTCYPSQNPDRLGCSVKWSGV